VGQSLAARATAQPVALVLVDDVVIQVIESGARNDLILELARLARAGGAGRLLGAQPQVRRAHAHIHVAPIDAELVGSGTHDDHRDAPPGGLLGIHLGKVVDAEGRPQHLQGTTDHGLYLVRPVVIDRPPLVGAEDDGTAGRVGQGHEALRQALGVRLGDERQHRARALHEQRVNVHGPLMVRAIRWAWTEGQSTMAKG